jgi:hypothetical protein
MEIVGTSSGVDTWTGTVFYDAYCNSFRIKNLCN